MCQSETFFLDTAGGRRLCVHHRPGEGQAARGALVFIHAFGDEMNKSRRMVREQARQLASAGFAVLQIDLKGCGDSAGDFVDASWSDWIDDVQVACTWLQDRLSAPLWLWGHRAGCLLAAQVAAMRPGRPRLLFWQAPASGHLLLQQFMRMKATSMMLDGNAKAVIQALRDQLAQDQAIEVGGYRVAASLANGLGQATLAPPAVPGDLIWLDVSTQPGQALSPVAAKTVAAWQAAHFQVQAQSLQGPAFWQTTELEDAPALHAATTAALLAVGGAQQPATTVADAP